MNAGSVLRWTMIVLSAGTVLVELPGCSHSAKIVTYKLRLMVEADSLFYREQFADAQQRYDKIRKTMPGTAEARTAHYSFAYSFVYFKNTAADWNVSLDEFKSFVSMYPDDPRAADALSWIRILTVIKSFNNEFKRATSMVDRLRTDKNESRFTQRVFLDSMATMMRACYENRDSLIKKNAELENVILYLEKKCQQAGK